MHIIGDDNDIRLNTAPFIIFIFLSISIEDDYGLVIHDHTSFLKWKEGLETLSKLQSGHKPTHTHR
nr:MAG TPA: protein of unknown function (DUF905) [Caudoviricetes sp.]